MYLVKTKKMPGTVSPEPGSSAGSNSKVNKVYINALARPNNYTDFLPALQEVEGYTIDAAMRKRLQKAKYAVDGWIDAAVGRGIITKQERKILSFIVNRTLRYGKTAEIITRHQFINGFSNGGEVEIDPPVTQNMQWYKGTAALADKDFISVWYLHDRRGSHCYTAYKLNIEQILSAEGDNSMGKLRIPKRISGEKLPGGVGKNLPGGVGKNLPTKYINKEIKEIEITHARARTREDANDSENAIDCKSRVAAVIEQASAMSRAKREAKASRVGKEPKTITLSTLNALWQKIMIEEYGSAINVAGLTVREFAILKKSMAPHHITFKWDKFLRWVVQSWVSLDKEQKSKRDYARKMQGATDDKDMRGTDTASPSLSGLVKRFAYFLGKYSDEANRSVVAPVTVTSGDTARLEAELAATKAKLDATVRALASQRVDGKREYAASSKIRLVADKGVLLDDDDDLPDWPGA